MRECEGLIPSLLHAVNSSLQSLNEIDNKSIENCMCILRNLSFKLQEVIDRDYDRNYPTTINTTSTMNMTPLQLNGKNKPSCMSSKQKKTKQIYEQIGNNIYAIMPPRHGRPVEMLWQPDVIGTYVHLLRHSSNPDTLEATAGCIQNLSMMMIIFSKFILISKLFLFSCLLLETIRRFAWRSTKSSWSC